MARKEKKVKEEGLAAWLITFSDLVTLLLTFFVLLLSMASMDSVMLNRMNPFQSAANTIDYKGSGKIPQRIKVVIKLLRDSQTALNKPQRIKDLLFPDDVLPPDIDRSTLDRNLRIMQKPEGLAIVLSDGLLFEPGSYTLSKEAYILLEQVALMLQYSTADCNIAGHTDSTPAGNINNYDLSGRRAMTVLEYFLKIGMHPTRFSISGYGPDKPLVPNITDEGRAQNRRVEILLKTEMWMGRYV